MGGSKAPDGRVRFLDDQAPHDIGDTRAAVFNQAPGTVTQVSRTVVKVWVHGGPDEGFTIDLHEGIPGWLLEKDAMFELTGDPQTGHYRFHRAAYLANDQVFRVSDQDLGATTLEGGGWDSNETSLRRDNGPS